MKRWRTDLLWLAAANVLLGVAFVIGLSMLRGAMWMRIVDHAQRLEQSGAIDYQRLTVAIGAPRPAGRAELEQAMGVDDLHALGIMSKVATAVFVAQAIVLVILARRIRSPHAAGATG